MLNELKQVADALRRVGVTPPTPSPLFKKNKRQDGLKLHLDAAGRIARITRMDAAEVECLFRYEKAAGASFPCFNFGPSRTATKDELKVMRDALRRSTDPAVRVELIRKQCGIASRAPINTDKIGKCLNAIPAETERFWSDPPPEFRAIATLIERLKARKWRPDEFFAEFEERLLDTFAEHAHEDVWCKTVVAASFESVPVLWELADLRGSEHAVTSLPMRVFLNERLVARATVEAGEQQITDSLSGRPGACVRTFPGPTLRVLGPSPLFSSPAATYCQDRYGLVEGAVFPTVKETAEELDAAIQWLCAAEREGITWSPLPHDSNGSQCLLLAYVEEMPTARGPFAALLSADADPAKTEARFEKQTETALSTLSELSSRLPAATVRVFVIGKPDPGRRNVLLNERFTVRHFAEAAQTWTKAQLSAPPFQAQWPTGRRAFEVIESYVCHPGDLVRLLNTAWLRGIAEPKFVPGCRFHQIYGLLLGLPPEQRRVAAELLPRALRQWTVALKTIGGHRHSARFREVSPKTSFFARQSISALTLLLLHHDRSSHQFMNDTAFHLGRALAWADTLHRYYCEIVRQNSLPPDLVGSSLLLTATNQPASALARLAERIKPYLSWAQTFSGDRAGFVRWSLRGFKESLGKVPRESLAQPFTDVDRAELLLGYVSDLQEQNIEKTNNTNS